MRDVEFRGKDITTGEWRNGYYLYIKEQNKHYILSGAIKIYPASPVHPHLMINGFEWFEVIPETVGEWTGLLDAKGVKIFERDTLTSSEYPFQDDGQYNYHAVVYWFEESAQFGYELKCVNSKKNGISDGICEAFGGRDVSFEVIGNVTDNPELLEAQNESL